MLYKLIERIALRKLKCNISTLFNEERSLAKNKQYVQASPNSPEKGWPDPSRTTEFVALPWKAKDVPTFAPIIASVFKSSMIGLNSICNNPINPKEIANKEFIMEFENYAKTLGIGSIGYTNVPREYIFKERAILFDNVIVLTMEMNKEKLNLAPSKDTEVMVFETYRDFSKVVNQLTNYLRKNGYAAQAGYPLGGLTLYPPLAQKAGLGWYGRHGLLITPEFGPRVRIGAIFTNIKNLPIREDNPNSWISDFCSKCGKCIKSCPGKAIYERPILHENGLITHIDRNKCFPTFNANSACSVCLKECTFNKKPYEEIKRSYFKSICIEGGKKIE